MKAKTCDIFVTMNWQERTKTKINGEHDDHEPSKINDCGIYKHAKSGRKRFPKPRAGGSSPPGRTSKINTSEVQPRKCFLFV